MPEEISIRVNFGKPMPIFPLDSVVLLPQQVLPLHIFEPRYRQMISDALDSSGQIAMATFRGQKWKQEYHGNPPIMPAVCVGQVVQHDARPDGRYNVLLQGVCRARVVEEFMPDEDRMYRQATLEPVGLDGDAGPEVEEFRTWLAPALEDGPLSRLAVAEQILEYVSNDDVPSAALLELVAFALLNDTRSRYRFLAEGDINRRAAFLEHNLEDLARLIRRGMRQNPEDWPKGLSWN